MSFSRTSIFQGRTFDDDIALKVPRGPLIPGWIMHPSDASEGSSSHRMSVEGTGMSIVVFGIPYRCLVPKDIEQLIVAGKTVSMTYEAHSRCRQMPDCMAFGQAAGAAAAIAVREKIAPRQVDTKTLRTLLTKQGVNLQKELVGVDKIREVMIGLGYQLVSE